MLDANGAQRWFLFSLRHSVARGEYVQQDREVTEANAEEWMTVFRKDEPGVVFLVAMTPPQPRMFKPAFT